MFPCTVRCIWEWLVFGDWSLSGPLTPSSTVGRDSFCAVPDTYFIRLLPLGHLVGEGTRSLLSSVYPLSHTLDVEGSHSTYAVHEVMTGLRAVPPRILGFYYRTTSLLSRLLHLYINSIKFRWWFRKERRRDGKVNVEMDERQEGWAPRISPNIWRQPRTRKELKG